MSQFTLINHRGEKTKTFDSRAAAAENRDDMVSLGASPDDFEIVQGAIESYADYAEIDTLDEQSASEATDGGTEVVEAEDVSIPSSVDEDAPPVDESETRTRDELSENPITFLRNVNSDFVNTIQGDPAISKQGFRFIQQRFDITTESEVVEWSDDPLGCVVWAKATLPDGPSAEAHGEGYQFESGVSDNEFVRYADTRAKNRALSDLTSAGALAVSELQEEQ